MSVIQNNGKEIILPKDPIEDLEYEMYGLNRGCIAFCERQWAFDLIEEALKEDPVGLKYMNECIASFTAGEKKEIHSLKQEIKSGKSVEYNSYQLFKTVIWLGDMAELSSIIEDGYDIETRMLQGGRPLHCAARVGNIPAMEALIAAGADINSLSSEGATPLHCCGNNAKATELLLLAGANVTVIDIDGNPTWNRARFNGDVADVYLKYGIIERIAG